MGASDQSGQRALFEYLGLPCSADQTCACEALARLSVCSSDFAIGYHYDLVLKKLALQMMDQVAEVNILTILYIG